MARGPRRLLIGWVAMAVWLFAAGYAQADTHEPMAAEAAAATEQNISVVDPTPDAPAPSDVDYAAANDPYKYPDLDVPTKPWAYDTGYIFGLTRGLSDEDLSTWERNASMAGTVPLDVVGLAPAAIAGLFGS